MGYRNATICKNGHVMSIYDANSQKYCSRCGKETYSYCTSCKSPIRGKYEVPGVLNLTGHYEKPHYCYNCGAPYPWTQMIIDNAAEILAMDIEISQEEKQLIKDAIPNLIVETPETPLAASKYKKTMAKVGETTSEVMRQLIIDVISETAKKILFPK